MLKTIFNKLFYNPYKFIKNHANIKIADSSILLQSCTFRFDGKNKNNSVIIGKNTMLGCSIVFESDEGKVEVGDNTFINSNTSLISRDRISIENNVTIAWGCTLYDHNSHSLDFRERIKDITRQNQDYRKGKSLTSSKDWNTVKSKPIVIEDNVWIGFDSVILSGVTVGEGAIIGARSVVREDVEPWTVVVGNPAVVVKRLKYD